MEVQRALTEQRLREEAQRQLEQQRIMQEQLLEQASSIHLTTQCDIYCTSRRRGLRKRWSASVCCSWRSSSG